MTSKHLVAALALAAACSGAAAASLYPTVLTNAGRVALKPDDDFLIALASNPSTGYRWSVAISNSKVVASEGFAYRAPSNALAGAGGEEVFSFEAQHAGSATITLAYGRPWEKNVKPVKVLVFIVSVAK